MDRVHPQPDDNPVRVMTRGCAYQPLVERRIPLRIGRHPGTLATDPRRQPLEAVEVLPDKGLPGVSKCSAVLEVPSGDILVVDGIEKYDLGAESLRDLDGMTRNRLSVMDRIQADEDRSGSPQHLAIPSQVAYTERSPVWVGCRTRFMLVDPGPDRADGSVDHAGAASQRSTVSEERR